uniref:C-type lectin domain-containing protein n=1 Tax=Balaenoptera musculus TaxID=9771 RepID=A0A8C0E1S8_BALMU
KMMPSMGLPSLSWMLLSCLMLLSQVQGETSLGNSQKELPSARISCPKGSMAYASYCYALFITPKPGWMPSGHLVSVLSGVEGSFEASLLKNNLKIFSDIWIGLHDPTEDSEPNASGREWSSTDVLNYVAWERNPATVSNPGYCEKLSRNTGYLKWRDYNCYVNLPYVCKFTD